MPLVGHPVPKRSPNYPGIDLGTALDKVKRLFAAIGRHPVGSGVAHSSMGYSPKSSSGLVAMAAIRAFGMVEDIKGQKEPMVKLSNRGLDIVVDFKPESEGWWKAAREAALAPKLHKELWDTYGSTLPPDEEIRRVLIREKGFIDSGAMAILAEYKKTIAFAKLNSGDIIQPCHGDDLDGDAKEIDNGGGEMDGAAVLDPPKGGRTPLKPTPSGTKQETSIVGDGVAVLQWPAKMTATDYEDFEGWLHLVMRKAKRSVIDPAPNDE